jgi:hypothetical protein
MVYIEAQRIVETSGEDLAGGSVMAPEVQAKRKGKGAGKQGGK